jgi:hypothetical protein
MDAAELVNIFIQRVVVKEKQARYTGFVGSSKNRKKFLEALDHKLGSEIDLSKTTKSLDGKRMAYRSGSLFEQWNLWYNV